MVSLRYIRQTHRLLLQHRTRHYRGMWLWLPRDLLPHSRDIVGSQGDNATLWQSTETVKGGKAVLLVIPHGRSPLSRLPHQERDGESNFRSLRGKTGWLQRESQRALRQKRATCVGLTRVRGRRIEPWFSATVTRSIMIRRRVCHRCRGRAVVQLIKPLNQLVELERDLGVISEAAISSWWRPR